MRAFCLLALLPLWAAGQSTRPIVTASPATVPLAPAAVAAPPHTRDDPEVCHAQEFFEQHYRYHNQPRYPGTPGVIRLKDELLVTYNRTDTLHIFHTDPVYHGLFTQGIIHPGQPESPFYKVCHIEPHPIPTESPQRRRFTLWHFNPKELNPEVYLFELTNPQATSATDQKTFVAGATLTFMKRGWGFF